LQEHDIGTHGAHRRAQIAKDKSTIQEGESLVSIER
jgi:hypothetical protein